MWKYTHINALLAPKSNWHQCRIKQGNGRDFQGELSKQDYLQLHHTSSSVCGGGFLFCVCVWGDGAGGDSGAVGLGQDPGGNLFLTSSPGDSYA